MENATSDVDVYALDCIRVRIRGLVGQKLIREDEMDDVCNDVYCEFLKRKHRFDPARGSYSTFVSCVIRNRVASIARARIELRRRCRFTEYSETVLVGGSPSPHFTRATTDVVDLQIAVRQAVSTLPDHLHSLANAMYTETLTEISVKTGKPRSSLYKQRAEIKSHFERLGLWLPASDGYPAC